MRKQYEFELLAGVTGLVMLFLVLSYFGQGMMKPHAVWEAMLPVKTAEDIANVSYENVQISKGDILEAKVNGGWSKNITLPRDGQINSVDNPNPTFVQAVSNNLLFQLVVGAVALLVIAGLITIIVAKRAKRGI